MTLTECSKCNGEISIDSETCPHCGAAISDAARGRFAVYSTAICAFVVSAVIAFYISEKGAISIGAGIGAFIATSNWMRKN